MWPHGQGTPLVSSIASGFAAAALLQNLALRESARQRTLRFVVEESLLTDEVRSHIGKTADRGTTRVTAQALRRASETFFGKAWEPVPGPGEEVPGITIGALDPDGDAPTLPIVLPNTLIVSNEWQFERPFRMGEDLEVRSRMADISEHFGGRFGYSLHFRTEVEFREPGSGRVVARTVQTMMQYDTVEESDEGDGE